MNVTKHFFCKSRRNSRKPIDKYNFLSYTY
nr:MAG TPA: hypothetical protein [Caudoviricetes sp.]